MALPRTALIVSPVLPVPEIQGNRRVIAELVRHLRGRGYRVLFAVQGTVRDTAIRAGMTALGAELVEVTRGRSPPRSRTWKWQHRIAVELRRFDRWNRRKFGLDVQLCGLVADWEERIAHFPNRECWDETNVAVRRLVAEQYVSVVISQYVYRTGALVGLPPHVLTMVHTHDCLSQVWEKMGRFGVDTHAREISRGLERRCLQRAQVVLALQPAEADTFRRLAPGASVIVLGFSPGPVPEKPLRNGSASIVFFPASNNPANRAGLRWLLEEVWPRVRAALPAAELRIAGEVSRWLGAPVAGVTALGALPDLRPEYAVAAVVVNPVSVGTGLKIKTVEALGLGKAVVSTSNGVEGLVVAETTWRRADAPAAFAEAIATLLQNPTERAVLEDAALTFARRELQAAPIFREFDAVLARHEAAFPTP